MSAPDDTRTQGTLLGGTVRYAQPLAGYRTGLEPVLLAATIPARPGQRVLEAGTGSGAGLLCLLARVPNLVATGIELDPAMAAIARDNLVSNTWSAPIHVTDVSQAGAHGPVDHAFANPPWHDPAGTPSPLPGRTRAKHLGRAGLAPWIEGLTAAVPGRGTVSLAIPAAMLGDALARLAACRFGRTAVLPLWPRPGVAAKLVLVQARRGAAQLRLLPGLVLHEGPALSAAAEAILRDGAALPVFP